MKASELFPGISLPDAIGDREIRSITDRASAADGGAVFVCIHGARTNGHTLAPEAYCSGCRMFVASEKLELPEDAWILSVPNTRRTLATLACRFYGDPSHRMQVIGITGTKGKTTVAQMIAGMLNDNGIRCGYIGTNGIAFDRVHRETNNTTPDPLTLQKALSEMAATGIRAVALEVSSQALKQFRAWGTRFSATIFTNLFPDHIGVNEHPDFADYLACKHRLFTDFPATYAIFNADDPTAPQMMQGCAAEKLLTFSMTDGSAADLSAIRILPTLEQGIPGISFCAMSGKTAQAYRLPMVGSYSAGNALPAILVCSRLFGLSPEQMAESLSKMQIPGRSEVFLLPSGGTVLIDYAHNGESLRRLLESLREYRPGRLLCLFGSVGERTKLRRREMGLAAAELSDLCFLTSDNPGEEPPEKIIAEIATAFSGFPTPYYCIPDREEAIRTAVQMTGKGDILVLAGKGQEQYQLIGKEKKPFSEKEILRRMVAENAVPFA